MVYYEHDYRSKKEIAADEERHRQELYYAQERKIKELTSENIELRKHINILHDLLKETNSEYGHYLKLKDTYGEV